MLLAGCGNDVVTETGWEAEYITVEYRAEGSECEGSSIRKDIGKRRDSDCSAGFWQQEHTYKVIVEPFTKDAMEASFEIVRKEDKTACGRMGSV